MPVSVLIVNFRVYDHLARCLDALDPFLAPDDEVIVVDNESDEEQLRQVVADRPQVVGIASAQNLGFAAAVNLAARRSSAPFLLTLNPDTELLGPALRVLEDWLVSHAATGIAGPRVINTDGSVQPSARRFPDVSTLFSGRSSWLTRVFPDNWFAKRNFVALGAADAIDVDWVSGACMITRRELFERLGGLDELFFLYCEDADYCRRASIAGHRCAYVPSVTVRHFTGASARHDPARAVREFHTSAFLFYWKHSRPFERLFAPLVRAGLSLRRLIHLRRALQHRRWIPEPQVVHVPDGEPSAAATSGSGTETTAVDRMLG